jgi:hypothetical protein
VILDESRGHFKPERMRFPDLGLLRDQIRVSMQIPGMYGVRGVPLSSFVPQFGSFSYCQGFNFWWEDGHLVSESYCRIAGGSERTNYVTPDGPKLVTDVWG